MLWEAVAAPSRRRGGDPSAGTAGAHTRKDPLSRPWGFAVEQITIADVHVWQGALDQNVSIDTGTAIARAIPHARGHFHTDEGHISVAVNHAADILRAVRT